MVLNDNNLDEIQDIEFKRTIINMFREFKEDTNKYPNELREARINWLNPKEIPTAKWNEEDNS